MGVNGRVPTSAGKMNVKITDNDGDELLSATQVAALLGMTVPSLTRMMRAGRWPPADHNFGLNQIRRYWKRATAEKALAALRDE
jgi:hypothetical protein